MNWIIESTERLKFHTNLNELFKGDWIDIYKYNWIVSDLDFYYIDPEDFSVNFEDDYFILTPDQFQKIVDTDFQLIWGVICAIPINETINFKDNLPPFADGNSELWKNGNLQVKNAVAEIIAWDSSYTFAKFSDKDISDKFKAVNKEAIALEKYKFHL